MGRNKLPFVLLVLLFGCVAGDPEGEKGKVQAQKGASSDLSFLQKIESGYYNLVCSVFGIFPTPVSGLVLKIPSFKGRLMKVGPPKRCGEIMIDVEYKSKFPTMDKLKGLKSSTLPVVWVIGGPGSGKGTLCSNMVAEGFTHISAGDLLRATVKSNPDSYIGKVLDRTMLQGGLVPQSATLTLLAESMMSKLDTSKGFLIDGFPRSLVQAKAFQAKIKPPDAIIYLEVSDETMRKRALNRNEGRKDDNELTFTKRLKTFHKQQELVVKSKIFASKVKRLNVEGTKEENAKQFSEIIRGLVKTNTSNK